MQSLITSYLLQSKECILPHIGIFKIINTPASTDSVNHIILPPFETIIFKEGGGTALPGLVKYISQKKQISHDEADTLLDKFCLEWKEKLDAGHNWYFETVGTLHKNPDGLIVFDKEAAHGFLEPMSVNSVYERTAVDQMPVADEEPVLTEANDAKGPEEVIVERSYWGIWALILLAIGFVMLFYHFKDQKITSPGIGNQHHYTVDSAKATYKLSK